MPVPWIRHGLQNQLEAENRLTDPYFNKDTRQNGAEDQKQQRPARVDFAARTWWRKEVTLRQ